jgi:hypothetical protein
MLVYILFLIRENHSKLSPASGVFFSDPLGAITVHESIAKHKRNLFAWKEDIMDRQCIFYWILGY